MNVIGFSAILSANSSIFLCYLNNQSSTQVFSFQFGIVEFSAIPRLLSLFAHSAFIIVLFLLNNK